MGIKGVIANAPLISVHLRHTGALWDNYVSHVELVFTQFSSCHYNTMLAWPYVRNYLCKLQHSHVPICMYHKSETFRPMHLHSSHKLSNTDTQKLQI